VIKVPMVIPDQKVIKETKEILAKKALMENKVLRAIKEILVKKEKKVTLDQVEYLFHIVITN
jgi:hypothetical protein